ncbi:PAS domain-containing protein [Dongia sp.]|uniref:PAS domain-containing protein n=1 Tax=Dongia sp. TaxID=1977262 RepID=UPI0035AF7939
MALSGRYRRITDTSFLQTCSPAVADYYRYWDGKRRGRAMPARADLDPLEMKPWLPGIILVDIFSYPDRMVYRLVGSQSVEMRGRNVTGLTVQEGFHGPSLDEVIENYRLVVTEQKPVYDIEGLYSANGNLKDSESLLLPLSSDGVTVDKVIIYIVINPVLHDLPSF